jgi:hypothetical protein
MQGRVRLRGAELRRRLDPIGIEFGDLRGKQAKLVLVDDSKTSHLNIDDVWLLH